jgi:hypothetical protein
MEISEKSRSVLAEGGWYTGRREATASIESSLESRGYRVSDVVCRFLAEFGQLAFATDDDEDWHFDPVLAIKHTVHGNVMKDSERAGVEICPVGEASRGHLLLTMDPRGRMFASYDDVLGIVGESPIEAIESLCEGRPLKPF